MSHLMQSRTKHFQRVTGGAGNYARHVCDTKEHSANAAWQPSALRPDATTATRLIPMTKPQVKQIRSIATEDNPEPLWEVIVDYGGGVEVVIPLRAHHLTTDDVLEQHRQACEAMESLARALLDFANQLRKRWSNDPA
jgi:hypothetical protein